MKAAIVKFDFFAIWKTNQEGLPPNKTCLLNTDPYIHNDFPDLRWSTEIGRATRKRSPSNMWSGQRAWALACDGWLIEYRNPRCLKVPQMWFHAPLHVRCWHRDLKKSTISSGVNYLRRIDDWRYSFIFSTFHSASVNTITQECGATADAEITRHASRCTSHSSVPTGLLGS